MSAFAGQGPQNSIIKYFKNYQNNEIYAYFEKFVFSQEVISIF